MKDLTIIANWKSRKTLKEAQDWLEEFKKIYSPKENITIVIAVPFTLLSVVSNFVKELTNV